MRNASSHRFLRTIAIILGVLFLVTPFVAWILGWAEIMAGANGELQRISANEQPSAYVLLKFGPWRERAGECSPSTYAPVPEDATITRHRIGHAYHFLTQMNYYEAEYALPDGMTEVNHAQGPLPLFTHRRDTMIVIAVLGLLLAGCCFVLATRSRRH